LAAILDSKTLTEVEVTPYTITKHLRVVFGPFSDDDRQRWGNHDFFAKRRKSRLGTVEKPARVYVAQLDKYPELVFIRTNRETVVAYTGDGHHTETVVACTKDGHHIATASREPYYRHFFR
jgi:hypothetical protein